MKKEIKKFGAIALAGVMSLSMITPSTVYGASDYANFEYKNRFKAMYQKIMDPSNGYFSADGVPYYSIETLIVDAPDYGHLTTSETFSYYMWLEAMNGKLSGDFDGFRRAWDVAEKYIIPSAMDQPDSAMDSYDPKRPATYAPELQEPSMYPAQLDTSAPVGTDPISADLKSAYGTGMIYGMHWLLDVDNWYGFGKRADGTSRNSYINTFQRGEQEGTWETIPHPCWDVMKFGSTSGYRSLFTGDSYAKEFKYTDAPDADARAVQATYWANEWAKEKGVDIKTYVNKASRMGDYLRYAMFDKYFRKVGSPSTAGTGYDSCMWLLSSYYAWGGGVDADWSWKIGSSHNQFGYQNPLTAWVLSTQSDFKPKAENATYDWAKSLDRQIDFYQWLQSDEGAIAGGASNSYNGRYEEWPSDTAIFYGMGYDENPVHKDPESNNWFGMQTRSMQRMAEYYYQTKDQRVKNLLDKWVKWAISTIDFDSGNGTFRIPNKIDWDGQPDTWQGQYTGNPNLHVIVTEYGTDLGVASSLANTLTFYAKASGDLESEYMAKKLLDAIWNNYQDDKGISVPETRIDYNRFLQEVYVPLGFSGQMPNGSYIKPGIKFIDLRPKYTQDPDWAKVEKYLATGNEADAPTMRYHRFWAQSEFAVATGIYAILFPGYCHCWPLKGDLNSDGVVDAIDFALMKMYLLNSSTAINELNADMNDDDSIDAIDFANLKKYLLLGY